MRILGWEFGRKQESRFTADVTQENEFLEALYKWIIQGYPINLPKSLQQYIEIGYQSNGKVYGVISKLAVMLKQIPIRVYEEMENGDLKEITNKEDPQVKLITNPNQFTGWRSFIEEFYSFYLTTGNALTYFQLLSGNQPRVDDNGLFIVPTGHVKPISGGWKRPIDYFEFDYVAGHKLMAENVLHVKFPDLEYKEGSHLMGMSPLRAAASTIVRLNEGNVLAGNLYKSGFPPGILSMRNKSGESKKEKEELRAAYRRKYTGERKGKEPIIGTGDMQWTKIGFDTLKDMLILEMSQDGLREICNVLNVPSILFNDVSGTTFNNMKEARAAIYTNRIIPDMDDICAEMNRVLAWRYGPRRIFKADYSGVEELMENKKDKAQWLNVGISNRSLSRNQWLEGMGYPTRPEPEFDDPNQNNPFFNAIGSREVDEEEVDKYFKKLGFDVYG